MDEALKYTAIALAAAICALTVKKQEPAIGSALSMAAGVALAAALLGIWAVCAEFVEKLCARIPGLADAVDVLFKVVGISVVTKIGAQVCRDCGENALALKLEFIGTGLALCAALPLLGALFDFAKSCMG